MKKTANYLVLFVVSSILGWAINTFGIYLAGGKYAQSTFLPYFSLIFGISSIVLILFFKHIKTHKILHIFGGIILVNLIELIGGILCRNVFKKEYWNYSSHFMNFNGYISLQQSVYWIILVSLFYYIYIKKLKKFF